MILLGPCHLAPFISRIRGFLLCWIQLYFESLTFLFLPSRCRFWRIHMIKSGPSPCHKLNWSGILITSIKILPFCHLPQVWFPMLFTVPLIFKEGEKNWKCVPDGEIIVIILEFFLLDLVTDSCPYDWLFSSPSAAISFGIKLIYVRAVMLFYTKRLEYKNKAKQHQQNINKNSR